MYPYRGDPFYTGQHPPQQRQQQDHGGQQQQHHQNNPQGLSMTNNPWVNPPGSGPFWSGGGAPPSQAPPPQQQQQVRHLGRLVPLLYHSLGLTAIRHHKTFPLSIMMLVA